MQTSPAAAKQGDEGNDSEDDGAFAGSDHRGEGLQGSFAREGSSLDKDFGLGDFDAETEAFAKQVDFAGPFTSDLFMIPLLPFRCEWKGQILSS